MQARDLCARLLTKRIPDLDEDQEDQVVDYLDDIGIEVDLDASQRNMCETLLRQDMEQTMGRQVPLGAYANKIIGDAETVRMQKQARLRARQLQKLRAEQQRRLLQNREVLGGCVKDNLFGDKPYNLRVNTSLGLEELQPGVNHYRAVVTLPSPLFMKVYDQVSNPILELTNFDRSTNTSNTDNGDKTVYVRIESANNTDSTVEISPLVANLLGLTRNFGYATIGLCVVMPFITKIDFTYYGTQTELDSIMQDLRPVLGKTVSAFSVLSLGTVLKTEVNGEEVMVRIDNLEQEGEPIYAGIIPTGIHDIPYDIEPDQ